MFKVLIFTKLCLLIALSSDPVNFVKCASEQLQQTTSPPPRTQDISPNRTDVVVLVTNGNHSSDPSGEDTKASKAIDLAAATTTSSRARATDGMCAFGFGVCGNVTDAKGRDLPVPCVYDGKPQVLEDKDLLRRFHEVCPSLEQEDALCCDKNQVSLFLDRIDEARDALGNCPSCFINFLHLFCDLTCNPRQAHFASVLKKTGQVIDTLSYNISIDYVNGLFDSCKDVVWSQMHAPAMLFLCGEDCTPTEWVEHLGSKGISPFDITYNYLPSNSPGLGSETKAIPCNASVGDYYKNYSSIYKYRCSYSDCPSHIQPSPKPDTPRILETVGAYVIVTFIFIMAAGLVSVLFDKRFNHRSIDNMLNSLFRNWALFCAHYATLVILLGVAAATLCFLGLTKLQILTDPVDLWSQPSSQAHQDKLYFEHNYGPFYRVQQVIIYPREGFRPWTNITLDNNDVHTFSNTFQLDFLMAALDLQHSIMNISAPIPTNDPQKQPQQHVNISEICIQPLKNGVCLVQSPLEYFQGNYSNFKLTTSDSESSTALVRQTTNIINGNENLDYLKHFLTCFHNYATLLDLDYHNLTCLGSYNGPIMPKLSLGGFPNETYTMANSIIITIPVNNDHKPEALKRAKAWELEFLKLLSSYENHPKLRVAYYSERSIEDEIERQSQSDVFTIGISYMVMFAYVALSLGKTTNFKTFLMESRIVLGLGGVLIVLASVLASIGILSFFGVKATLIIIEVIPFLVLAVGVDNIFIIVQSLQRSSNEPHLLNASVEERISVVMGEVAPSLLLASLSESACFLIGTLTPMPAVRVFAMTASLALLVDFLLQMTVFIGLLTLDTKRQFAGRYDLLCCITASKSSQTSLIGSPEIEPVHHHHHYQQQPQSIDNTDTTNGQSNTVLTSPTIDSHDIAFSDERHAFYPSNIRSHGLLYHLFEKYLIPTLLSDWVRCASMFLFLSWLCISAFVIPKIDVGLDQTMSVPDDSYIQEYFTAQRSDLRAGPPVYFVLKRGLDFANGTERDLICSSPSCSPISLLNQIANAYRQPNSYLASTANTWIDDYKSWGQNSKCCMKRKGTAKRNTTSIRTKRYSSSSQSSKFGGEFCPQNTTHIDVVCEPCDLVKDGMFDDEHFYDYLDNYLVDIPRPECPKAGGSDYSGLVHVHKPHNSSSSSGSLPPNQVSYYNNYHNQHVYQQYLDKTTIDSAFMAYHVPLKSSKDFIESMRSARYIAQNIEDTLNKNLRVNSKDKLHVFPYCFTYVFYEQYLTIWQQAIRNLSISMVTIFVVSYLLLGCDLYISIIILGTIASIVIDLMGLMYFWSIQLNAISLVNLVMAVGISVEFCSHVARSFALSQKSSPTERAHEALVKMGSSVLSGITFTKVAGISVLAFAKSRIFKVYYFRMYMGIVLVGAIHGIIFMPIILSLTARDRKSRKQSDDLSADETNAETSSQTNSNHNNVISNN